mmetsp:Transcript_317/g.983  ORF Transcript_317/g.983 Transcript_317/m.983 type:complete len:493 (-) Transcript_317:56-1534(-)
MPNASRAAPASPARLERGEPKATSRSATRRVRSEGDESSAPRDTTGRRLTRVRCSGPAAASRGLQGTKVGWASDDQEPQALPRSNKRSNTAAHEESNPCQISTAPGRRPLLRRIHAPAHNDDTRSASPDVPRRRQAEHVFRSRRAQGGRHQGRGGQGAAASQGLRRRRGAAPRIPRRDGRRFGAVCRPGGPDRIGVLEGARALPPRGAPLRLGRRLHVLLRRRVPGRHHGRRGVPPDRLRAHAQSAQGALGGLPEGPGEIQGGRQSRRGQGRRLGRFSDERAGPRRAQGAPLPQDDGPGGHGRGHDGHLGGLHRGARVAQDHVRAGHRRRRRDRRRAAAARDPASQAPAEKDVERGLPQVDRAGHHVRVQDHRDFARVDAAAHHLRVPLGGARRPDRGARRRPLPAQVRLRVDGPRRDDARRNRGLRARVLGPRGADHVLRAAALPAVLGPRAVPPLRVGPPLVALALRRRVLFHSPSPPSFGRPSLTLFGL